MHRSNPVVTHQSSEFQIMLTRHATPFDLFEKLEQQLAQAERVPAAEVIETNDSFQISLELPGVDRESIDVKATERSLVISAERKAPESPNETEAQALVREFRYGIWSRSFRFPRGINRDGLKANFKDGLLQINAPKAVSNAAVSVVVEG
jgi:HSP20 family protein